MEEEIKHKTEHCLDCKTKPCQAGCPLENDIPAFIQAVKEKNYQKAYEISSKTTVLQPICGRICPHESQCQGNCVRRFKSEPTQIGQIEAAIGDFALENKIFLPQKEKKEQKIAIIGSGPAGLTCAAFLAKEGYQVTIWERRKQLGGLLEHGIPEFRLEKEIVTKTVDHILRLGIEVKCEQELGSTVLLSDLRKQYDAIFLAFGANSSSKMGIEGEETKGVLGGNELLETQDHPDYQHKRVAIIGGGNVAMDCARTIKRKGAQEVSIIYRRAEKQMPAEKKEIEEAKIEGVTFLFQHNITKIVSENKKVAKIECIQTELIKKEGETREVPIDIEGSNYELPMDYVVMAIGSHTETPMVEYLKKEGISFNQKGYINVNKDYQTSLPEVYAGGDAIGQKSTVAWAARAGRKAAEAIMNHFFDN